MISAVWWWSWCVRAVPTKYALIRCVLASAKRRAHTHLEQSHSSGNHGVQLPLLDTTPRDTQHAIGSSLSGLPSTPQSKWSRVTTAADQQIGPAVPVLPREPPLFLLLTPRNFFMLVLAETGRGSGRHLLPMGTRRSSKGLPFVLPVLLHQTHVFIYTRRDIPDKQYETLRKAALRRNSPSPLGHRRRAPAPGRVCSCRPVCVSRGSGSTPAG